MQQSKHLLKAWVHFVSANPLNDDQLLLANDVAALLEQVKKYEDLVDCLCDYSTGMSVLSEEKIQEKLRDIRGVK